MLLSPLPSSTLSPCHILPCAIWTDRHIIPNLEIFSNTTSNHPTRNFTPMALLWPRTTSTINATSAKMASTMPKVIGTSITLCIGHIAWTAAPPVWCMDVSQKGRAGEAISSGFFVGQCKQLQPPWIYDSEKLQVNPTFALCLSKISFQATNDEPYMLRMVSQASDFSTSLTLRSGQLTPRKQQPPALQYLVSSGWSSSNKYSILSAEMWSTIQEWRSKTI